MSVVSWLEALPREIGELLLEMVDCDDLASTNCASGRLRRWVAPMAAKLGYEGPLGTLFLRQLAASKREGKVAASYYNGLVLDSAQQLYSFARDGIALGRRLPEYSPPASPASSPNRAVPLRRQYLGRPLRVDALSSIRVTRVAVGSNCAFATGEKGLWAWGANEQGELGLGDRTQRAWPTLVNVFDGACVSSIAARDHSTVAVFEGAVYAWGKSFNLAAHSVLAPKRLFDEAANFVAASLGGYFSVVLDSKGDAHWWAYSSVACFTSPPTASPQLHRIPLTARIVQVSAGYRDCLLLAANGSVFACSSTARYENRPTPKVHCEVRDPAAVPGLPTRIAAVHAGFSTSFALTHPAGKVFAWLPPSSGTNDEPRPVEALADDARVTNLGGADGFIARAVGLFEDDDFYTWGDSNVYLNDDEPGNRLLLEPRKFRLSGEQRPQSTPLESPPRATAYSARAVFFTQER